MDREPAQDRLVLLAQARNGVTAGGVTAGGVTAGGVTTEVTVSKVQLPARKSSNIKKREP
jgi:hypothetical protein